MKALIDAEEWRDIPEWEGMYQVSSFGRIKSVGRKCSGGRNQEQIGRRVQEKIKALGTHKQGYRTVTFCKDSKTCLKLVHRLVAISFIPNPENLPEVNHIDGDPSNNSINNLEWVCRKDNSLHSTRVLKKNIGSSNTKSVLSEDQVSVIKQLIHEGMTNSQIAETYPVTHGAISRIRRGWNWKHVSRKEGGISCVL